MTVNFFGDKINFIKQWGVFVVKASIEINKNKNQDCDLIFSKKGKLIDGSATANSQYYIRIKRSDLDFIDNKKCYALYKQNEKNGDFVLDGTFDPIILLESTIDKEKEKNFFETMCAYNEDVYGLRFCFADGKLEGEEAKNASLDNSSLVWLELKIDNTGDKFLAQYNPLNKVWERTNISFALKDLFGGNDIKQSGRNSVWEMYPKKKYGDGRFLTTFATQDCIDIKTNNDPDNPLEEMKEIVENDTGLSIDYGNMKIYTCMQFEPNGEFYLDWGPEDITAKKAFKTGLGTINNHNKKMEDVLALRFYVTPERLDIHVGQKFDEAAILNPARCSVFEIRRDVNNNMVMWHFDRNNNNWIPVDATIIHKVEYEQSFQLVDIGFGRLRIPEQKHKDIHEYKCKLNLNSYSVKSLWKYGRENKFQDENIFNSNIEIPIAVQVKRFYKYIKRNKSKIIFSVFVGCLSAIWIGWFAVLATIVLFLILFVIDKFAKCPSVEKWFKKKKRANDVPPRLVQQNRVRENFRREAPVPNNVNDVRVLLILIQIIAEQEIRRQNNIDNPNMIGINNMQLF